MAAVVGAAAAIAGFAGLGEQAAAVGAAVALAWDPNPEEEIAGYRVYYGEESRRYSARITLGKTTACVVSDLPAGRTYYFAVTAWDAAGQESGYSEEALHSIPAAPVPAAAAGAGPDGIAFEPGGDAGRDAQDFAWVETRWQIFREEDRLLILDLWRPRSPSAFTVPDGILEAHTAYAVRLRHADEAGFSSGWSPETAFSTGADPADLTGDGIPDAQEVGRPTDLDRDGEPDGGREGFVRIAAADGRGAIGLQAGPGAALAAVMRCDLADPALDLPYGLLRYKVILDRPGEEAAVTVYFPKPLPAGAAWHRRDPFSGSWQAMPDFAATSPDRRRVTLSLADGGAGDADGVANGIIVDASGPAIPLAPAIGNPPPQGSGGGCFIAASAGHQCARPAAAKAVVGLLLGGGLFLPARRLRPGKPDRKVAAAHLLRFFSKTTRAEGSTITPFATPSASPTPPSWSVRTTQRRLSVKRALSEKSLQAPAIGSYLNHLALRGAGSEKWILTLVASPGRATATRKWIRPKGVSAAWPPMVKAPGSVVSGSTASMATAFGDLRMETPTSREEPSTATVRIVGWRLSSIPFRSRSTR
jgi:hypothetical protein